MFSRFDTIPACDGRADGQQSFLSVYTTENRETTLHGTQINQVNSIVFV